MTQSNDSGFDSFLVDEAERDDNVDYIKPDIELKLPANKRKECRDIVQEIKKFGISSQRQMLYLIYLLALEIEDQTTMKAIVNACKSGRKDLGEEKKLILTDM